MLATELVKRFHGKDAAAAAARDFADRFQRRVLPEEVPSAEVCSEQDDLPLAVLLRDAGLTTSSSESMRMIAQHAVKIDGEMVEDKNTLVSTGSTNIYQVGKRKIFRINLVKSDSH